MIQQGINQTIGALGGVLAVNKLTPEHQQKVQAKQEVTNAEQLRKVTAKNIMSGNYETAYAQEQALSDLASNSLNPDVRKYVASIKSLDPYKTGAKDRVNWSIDRDTQQILGENAYTDVLQGDAIGHYNEYKRKAMESLKAKQASLQDARAGVEVQKAVLSDKNNKPQGGNK